jgi:hypothetical protein
MKNNDDIVTSNPPKSESRRVRERKPVTGNWNPDWEPFAKLDPAWTDKVIAMAIAPAVAGALDAKTIELIGIALDVSCTNMYAPGVRRHIQRALKPVRRAKRLPRSCRSHACRDSTACASAAPSCSRNWKPASGAKADFRPTQPDPTPPKPQRTRT